MTEQDVKKQIRELLSPDFYIKEEVWGQHMVDGARVRIDFLVMPKIPLINRGFDKWIGGDAWIGIEAKGCDEEGDPAKGIQLAWQAVTYANSVFGECGRPPFVLVCPPLWNFLHSFAGSNGSQLFLDFLQKANVGVLDILTDRWTLQRNDGVPVWRMKFGSNVIYWDSVMGMGHIAHAAVKRNVGSWS
jgi:hypothetical protein